MYYVLTSCAASVFVTADVKILRNQKKAQNSCWKVQLCFALLLPGFILQIQVKKNKKKKKSLKQKKNNTLAPGQTSSRIYKRMLCCTVND